MRQEKASLQEFVAANWHTGCINLFWLSKQHSLLEQLLLGIANIVTVWKQLLEQPQDMKDLDPLHLVWYRPNQDGRDGWQYQGSTHYTVGEFAQLIQTNRVPPAHRGKQAKIEEYVRRLRNGWTEDIVLLVAYDTGLDKRVIVDGCHRAVALSLLESTDSWLALRSYSIALLQLESEWARTLYPCDFLRFKASGQNHERMESCLSRP